MEMNDIQFEKCDAYIRTYTFPIENAPKLRKQRYLTEDKEQGHYQVLTIDTETTMSSDKTLLYGWYMMNGYKPEEADRDKDKNGLREFGVFYNENSLEPKHIANLQSYARSI